jgi:hypothetical protein
MEVKEAAMEGMAAAVKVLFAVCVEAMDTMVAIMPMETIAAMAAVKDLD